MLYFPKSDGALAKRRPDGSLAACMEALAAARGMLAQVADRNRRLRTALADAQAELALARAELARARADEMKSRHQALHDGLTRLPNRRQFHDKLGQALSSAMSGHGALAVFYLDLDGFKPINDLYGHAAGDELLRIVAARLSNAVRASDMVCRLGGDEFGCLFAELPDLPRLRHLAIKLFNVVSAPLTIGRLELSVRPSIGIARSPSDGATPDELLRSADAAMYRAKRQRTGYAFVEQRNARLDAPPISSIAHRPRDLALLD